MRAPDLGFTDPTIPGLSVRDLASRAADAVLAPSGGNGKGRHRYYVIRHDLAGLDQEMLRDLGLDRGRA